MAFILLGVHTYPPHTHTLTADKSNGDILASKSTRQLFEDEQFYFRQDWTAPHQHRDVRSNLAKQAVWAKRFHGKHSLFTKCQLDFVNGTQIKSTLTKSTTDTEQRVVSKRERTQIPEFLLHVCDPIASRYEPCTDYDRHQTLTKQIISVDLLHFENEMYTHIHTYARARAHTQTHARTHRHITVYILHHNMNTAFYIMHIKSRHILNGSKHR